MIRLPYTNPLKIQIHSKSIKILYLFGKKEPIFTKEASYLSPLAGVRPQGGPVDLRLEVTTETGTQGGNGLHWSWRTDESGLVGIQRTTPHQVSGLHLGCTLVKRLFFFSSLEFPVVFFWVLFGGVVYILYLYYICNIVLVEFMDLVGKNC